MLTTVQMCPHCGRSVSLQFRELHQYGEVPLLGERDVAELAGLVEVTRRKGTTLAVHNYPSGHPMLDQEVLCAAVLICPRCAEPVFAKVKMPRILAINHAKSVIEGVRYGNTTDVTQWVTELLPAPPTSHRDPDWPENVRNLFADAQTALRLGMSPVMVVSTCRTVLETCLKTLGAKGDTIAQRIQNLRGNAVITEAIAAWATEIRTLGNDAIHDAEASRDDAVALVGFLIQFMIVAFSIPAGIELRRKGKEIFD